MSHFKDEVDRHAINAAYRTEAANERLGAALDWVVERLVGFFLPVKKLSVTFNPEMCYRNRHATLLCSAPTVGMVGIMLSHPEVLLFCRSKHLAEILRQAKLCGFSPTHLEIPGGQVIHLFKLNCASTYRPSM